MKIEPTIRTATDSDARGIARILVDGWQATYKGIVPPEFLASVTYDGHESGTQQLLRSLPDTSAVFVAEDQGAIIGVALVRSALNSSHEYDAEVDALYVAGASQRRGVGIRLFQRVTAWSRQRRVQSLRVWVFKDNPFRSFYERLAGTPLAGERQGEFAGATVVSVSYEWRDLQALATLLDVAIQQTPI